MTDLRELLPDGWVPAKCARCGGEYFRLPDGEDDECADCRQQQRVAERLAVECGQVLGSIDRWFPSWCARAGMAPRELTATIDGIPAPVRAALSSGRLGVKAMTEGELPERGFGISGGAGTGKTFALSAIFRSCAVARIRAWAPLEGRRAAREWLAWVRWPEEVNRMRGRAADDGLDAVDRRVAALRKVEALVLDDLGAERMKGSDYAEDWATSVLDAIVDARFNAMLPTWWTTNLTADEFIGRYGARLWSRLAGDSPLVSLKPSPDLRVVRGAKP